MVRCDNCRTNFDCRTLGMALKVLGAHEDEIEDPELLNRYRGIVKILADAKWSYPDGTNACRLVNLPREVQALSSELVKLWQRSHWHAPAGEDQGTYEEEVRSE